MVALLPDPDTQLGERICAVVVPRDPAPTLAELRDHLRTLGMSAQYWPDRLHLVQAATSSASSVSSTSSSSPTPSR